VNPQSEVTMSSGSITRIRFLAAVAVLGGGLTLTACSTDTTSGAGDTAAVPG
jgi:hypothetical protein